MPLLGCLFEHVEHPGLHSPGRVVGLAHLAGDLVGGAEADPGDLPGEAVGIGSEHVDRLRAVGLEEPEGAGGGEPVLVEEDHDVVDLDADDDLLWSQQQQEQQDDEQQPDSMASTSPTTSSRWTNHSAAVASRGKNMTNTGSKAFQRLLKEFFDDYFMDDPDEENNNNG